MGKLAPLIYFFPGQTGIPAAYRGRLGVDPGFWGKLSLPEYGTHRLDQQNRLGPEELRGLMVAPGDFATDPLGVLEFAPDRQRWVEIEDGVWLGVADSAQPTDFLRKDPVRPGYFLLTERGGETLEWWIPVALLDSPQCTLPQVDMIQRGKWLSRPRPEYADIAAAALRLYQVELGEAEPLSREELREIAISAIAINYALTPAEMGALELLCDDTYKTVSDLLTDLPARLKKKEEKPASESPSTDSGGPDA